MNFNGDVLLGFDSDGDLDIIFENGQTVMTEYFDNLVFLYCMGEDNWQNAIARKESEKLQSKFPSVTDRDVISDEVLARGESALINALSPLKTEKIANSIKVISYPISIYVAGWEISITRFDGIERLYKITWDGEVSNFDRIF